MERNVRLFVITLTLFYLGFSPKTKAVSPAPDGGYAGFNTAGGQDALFSLTTGMWNTALGFQALYLDTSGVSNTATGARALWINSIGSFNTADGTFGLFGNTSGHQNCAIGWGAMASNTTGTANIALGFFAGGNLTTGNGNIDIGNSGVPGESTAIRIGAAQTKAFIAGIRGVTTTNNDAMPVVIDSAGQLGTANSSRRYKTDIKPIDTASESILGLKPVRFHYKVHKDETPQFGLIAEEVAEVNPDLVIYDADGKPYSVRYEAVNAMLLNEFLKEHGKVQKLEANAARQQRQIEALTTGLQKVTAELELTKSTPRIAVDRR